MEGVTEFDRKSDDRFDRPLAMYRMFGIPCGVCLRPLDHMVVRRTSFEMWHVDDLYKVDRQRLPDPTPCEVPLSPPVKVWRKGQLHACPQCTVLHTDGFDLCQSCRRQEVLF